jgi:hypothetical protein
MSPAPVSTKAYRGLDATLGWMRQSTSTVSSKLTFRNNTQDDFYGLGMDTTDATRVDYGIRTTDLATRAAVHVSERGSHRCGHRLLRPRCAPWTRRQPADDSETIFTDATAPGLRAQPHFMHDSVFAEVDMRDAQGFPRRGGFYARPYALWNDTTLEQVTTSTASTSSLAIHLRRTRTASSHCNSG